MSRRFILTIGLGVCSVAASVGCNTLMTTPPVGPTGPAGADGAAGAAGAVGADGQLRIYGNGSANALIITGGVTKTIYTDVATDFNLQFTNLTIDAGNTLNVPSGTVIRCNGTCTINGTMTVTAVTSTMGAGYFQSGTGAFTYDPAGAGISGDTANGGAFGDSTDVRGGGRPGLGLSVNEARNILLPGPLGGGGGAGGIVGGGGSGGGTLVILAQTSITIGATGVINANGSGGAAGGGGGGGGFVVFASPGSINNAGAINVKGGAGGTSGIGDGPGGGGGGGFVNMLSPAVTAGVIDFTDGAAGLLGPANSVTNPLRDGGGGGGGCVGRGGLGGSVSAAANGTPGAAGTAINGASSIALVNPTALF